MPPKENEMELSELFALEEEIADLENALYDARKQLKNVISIPDNATNGDAIKTILPNLEINPDPYIPSVDIYIGGILMMRVDREWWNAPYKSL